MPHVTFVKKLLTDGSLCKKCKEVSERLAQDGLLSSIDQIVLAHEGEADSAGMKLALEHGVSRAPFFLVEEDKQRVLVFDVYFKFRKHMTNLLEKTAS